MLREYRRDVGRYFKGDSEKYPSMPHSYFDSSLVETLTALQEKAARSRSGDLLLEITNALGEQNIANTWSPSATGIYKNWLDYICAQKERTLQLKRIKAMTHAARVEWASTTLKRSDRGIV